jgi:hypothetical protein
LKNIDEVLKIKEEINAIDTKLLHDVSYVAREIGQKKQ